MGLIDDIINSVRNVASGFQNNLNSIRNMASDYVSSFGRKPKVGIEDLDEEEFDRIARERGYRKTPEARERMERLAEEDRPIKTRFEEEEEDLEKRAMEYAEEPMTKEEFENLEFHYYAKYVINTYVRYRNKNGEIIRDWTFLKQQSLVSNTHPSGMSVLNELRAIAKVTPRERSDTKTEVIYELIKVNVKTREETVIDTGSFQGE